MSEAFAKVVEMALALGARDVATKPGCWEHAWGETPEWYVAINPHLEPTDCSRGVTVDPGYLFIAFNGWPAGMLHPGGGAIAAGAAANEDSFIAAVEAETARVLAEGPRAA